MIEEAPRHVHHATQLGMSAVSLKVSQRGFIPIKGSRAPVRRARGDASACAANDKAASVTQRNVISRRPLITLPLAGAALTGASGRANADPSEFASDAAMAVLERRGDIAFTEDEWKAKLEPFTYKVLRKEATERPFSSELNKEKRTGTFVCAGCGTPLFDSSTKYDSGTGWPSFYDPLPGAVMEVPDFSIMFMPRSEVRCKACQGHLGHVFEDGPPPTGLRYCMNGAAMKFEPKSA